MLREALNAFRRKLESQDPGTIAERRAFLLSIIEHLRRRGSDGIG